MSKSFFKDINVYKMHVWCECGQIRPGALDLRANHGHTDIFIIQNPLFWVQTTQN